ncbi:MAG: type II toxin-antitoxin system VapC family toxin [Armatimonadota bacterium]
MDSSGWIDLLVNGPRAGAFRKRIDEADDVLVPALVIFEVGRFMLRQRPQVEALATVARLRQYNVAPLDAGIAVEAADLSLQHDLPMADALIYATAVVHSAILVTADTHFQDMPGVEYIAAEEQGTAS